MQIALIQIPSTDGKPLKSFQKLEPYLNDLPPSVNLVVLPEMWSSGFQIEQRKTILEETALLTEKLKEWCLKRNCFLIGSQLESTEDGSYNSSILFGPKGEILSTYRKIHLFQLGKEDQKFIPGKEMVNLSTPIGNLGFAICYDIRFPEMIRKIVLNGAEIILIPAAWPLERIPHYLTLLQARAIENLCFIVSVNKVGKNHEGIPYGGNSVGFDPWGNCLGKMDDKEGVLIFSIDLNLVKDTRKKFPVFEARREDIY